MMLPTDTIPPHPATFRSEHIALFRDLLSSRDVKTILDPFAGIGTIHDLRPEYETWGIEREPEWANARPPYTLVGDALEARKVLMRNGLPTTFDAAITSPVWGNRMSDHHEAKDDSIRNTYRHKLGRPITEGSSAILQWGPAYREFHLKAWTEMTAIVERFFILNIKDHVRKGEIQMVTQWHHQVFVDLGWMPRVDWKMLSPGQRFGENHELRVEHEHVILFEKMRDGNGQQEEGRAHL
ncbi:MAG: hypothetical protein R3330_08875 [Saprospiraceae bacterium]|nr:hypothetical protein [Saprospiraceae bacterium]